MEVLVFSLRWLFVEKILLKMSYITIKYLNNKYGSVTL